ncbi:uncharacterized protein LOC141611938 [Silene latifolia]|uniref:uncharacterized protein LOC141611938 n=1 Tax=Silene latifolia TaxID=37657 RepID=UPI003D76F8B9
MKNTNPPYSSSLISHPVNIPNPKSLYYFLTLSSLSHLSLSHTLSIHRVDKGGQPPPSTTHHNWPLYFRAPSFSYLSSSVVASPPSTAQNCLWLDLAYAFISHNPDVPAQVAPCPRYSGTQLWQRKNKDIRFPLLRVSFAGEYCMRQSHM